MTDKHSHYFKDVSNLQKIDVYRVLELFGVTDPCLQHAVKKLLVAGGRGAKSIDKDIQEAIDTLQRWQAMRTEDEPMPWEEPVQAAPPGWYYGVDGLLYRPESVTGMTFEDYKALYP